MPNRYGDEFMRDLLADLERECLQTPERTKSPTDRKARERRRDGKPKSRRHEPGGFDLADYAHLPKADPNRVRPEPEKPIVRSDHDLPGNAVALHRRLEKIYGTPRYMPPATTSQRVTDYPNHRVDQ